ncbi:MAG TPA: ABC transporter permease [Bacteroidota bacterium]
MTLNILPIVKKEFRQIRRDKRALGILIFLPAFMLLLVGYALNFDVKHLKLAVYDEDRSSRSRELVASMTQSDYFGLALALDSKAQIDRVLENGDAHLALVIPSDFSRKLDSGNEATVQVIIDGSNSNSATTAGGYMAQAILAYSTRVQAEWLEQRGRAFTIPLDIRPRLLYNPELKTAKYLVPGLFGLILMIATVISTSLSIVREKEMGTMEQLKTSPLRAEEIIIGKTIPYLIIALFSSTLVLILGWLLFDVSVRGDLLLLYSAILLFLIAGLAQGMLISSVAETQQVAYLMSVFSSLLPAFLLSGFIFPIQSMPVALQVFSNLMATKFFLSILRSIILKGVGFEAVWEQFVYLIIFAVVVLGISSARLKKELSR